MSAAVQEFATTVGTSAVALGSNGFQGRAGITIFNSGGGGVLYVGGPGITIGNGIALASNNTPLTINTPQSAGIYGISSLAGTLVKTLEF